MCACVHIVHGHVHVRSVERFLDVDVHLPPMQAVHLTARVKREVSDAIQRREGRGKRNLLAQRVPLGYKGLARAAHLRVELLRKATCRHDAIAQHVGGGLHNGRQVRSPIQVAYRNRRRNVRQFV